MRFPVRSVASLLVLVLGAVAAPRARAATNAFLKLGDIPGDSHDPDHMGWIEISSWQFDELAQSSTTGGAASGAGAGKVRVSDFQITKSQDAATAKLALAAGSGRHFPQATIEMRKAGGDPKQPYLVIKLSNVYVSNYHMSSGGDRPTESLTLNFTKVEFVYSQQHTTSPATRGAAFAPGAAAVALAAAPTITKVTPSSAGGSIGHALSFEVEGTGSCNQSRIDFGDGTVSEFPFSSGKSMPAPTHSYSRMGTFEVKAYGLADPWAKLPAPPPSSAAACGGHASATVTITAPLSVAPAPVIRK